MDCQHPLRCLYFIYHGHLYVPVMCLWSSWMGKTPNLTDMRSIEPYWVAEVREWDLRGLLTKIEGRKSNKVAIGSNSLKVEVHEGQKSQGRSAITNIAILKFTKVEILKTMGENCMLYFRSYLPFYIHIDTTIDKGDNKKCNNKEKGPSRKEQTKCDTSTVGVA